LEPIREKMMIRYEIEKKITNEQELKEQNENEVLDESKKNI